MTRKESREKAVLFLYEYSAQPELTPSKIMSIAKEDREEDTSPYTALLFKKTVENISAIDEKIASAAENWSFKRISKVTLAILRVAVCELCFLNEPVPVEIAVNEALELARLYDSDNAIPFINGVLAKIVKGNE